MSYLNTVYSRDRAPKTKYPFELIDYLYKRFHLKKGNRILELGVGNGDFLVEFQKKGLICTGVDIEISPLTSPKLKLKKINLSKGKLPFPDRSFDIVYHKSMLEHFYRDEAEQIMKETYRVLKKGGILIILVPDWVSQMETFFEDYTHVHPYDQLAISDLLNIYNFKGVKSEKFYQLPILWKYPFLKIISRFLNPFLKVSTARRFTEVTGIKFFRWSRESMILAYGKK
jgi:SAM-dependent methyltransferase